MFEDIDVLVMPTVPKHYTHEEVEHDPFATNAYLGTFSHCVNLLDLCAIAIPIGATSLGLPFGVTLVSKAGFDFALLQIAADVLGEESVVFHSTTSGEMHLAVCGAHMTGQPLNSDLKTLGGKLIRLTQTRPSYQLFALPNGIRPVLIRNESEGTAIELEVWTIPTENLGGFVNRIESPLAIGSIELEDGEWVKGFVGDFSATDGAVDITSYGGWRNFRRSTKTCPT